MDPITQVFNCALNVHTMSESLEKLSEELAAEEMKYIKALAELNNEQGKELTERLRKWKEAKYY